MLIDCSYFTSGPRHIQNATLGIDKGLPNPNATEVNAAIEAYIAEYQEEYLRLAIGSYLGNKVNAYLVCLDEDENPKHNEHFDAVCERLKESFADYVYFHILRYSNSQSTMTGLVQLKCANEYVAPIRRQVNIWNAMVDKHKEFVNWGDCPISGVKMDSELITYINQFNL